jgi:putative oxidoreductase
MKFASLDRCTVRVLSWAAAVSFLAPLLTRLVVGQAFYQAGAGKLENIEGVTAFFTSLGIPFPELNAAFVSRVEYYGGMLLVLGLATRLASIFLASTMVVALLTADRGSFISALQGTGDTGLTDVAPVVLLLYLIWLVLYGPGAVSADALVKRFMIGRDEPHSEAG